MKIKIKQILIKIENYSLYNVITPNGWSIVIMDDNILFDNYHSKGVHFIITRTIIGNG